MFLKANFCCKKEKIILKMFGWENPPLTTISFERSIQEKNGMAKTAPIILGESLLSSLISKNLFKVKKVKWKNNVGLLSAIFF